MDKVKDSKLLVVGAGGIGCELLKNLVLAGFNQIEVIDLDTIELSNLNRQFLFQKCHVGKPKAIIARESVLKYNPNANISAYHDSIMNVRFGVDYFKTFSIVLNALDNKAARSHVNRLCLAADIPLIESGSAGYLGQVTLIKRGFTECYDCLPKPPVKTFPGCTIRNTPSEPIHCIVWAKHLFNQLFGAEDPDEAVSPDGEDPENMAEAGKTAVEKAETEEAVVRQSTRQWAKETNYDSVKIFNKLFCDDIKYLLSMAKLWEKRKAPMPIDWNESVKMLTNNHQTTATNSTGSSQQLLSSHRIITIAEYAEMFKQSVSLLRKRLEESKEDSNPILVWDKDDEDALNFVTAASNLRCYIFSISLKSKFETKSLAGQIIPAIATTNAIVAGLIVLQALKVLNNQSDECKTVYLRDKPSNKKLIVSSELVKPNEKCYVCANKPEIIIKLNTDVITIKQFETKILKQELTMIQPDVEIDDGTGRIIISSEEGETEENNDKTLAYFGLGDKSALKCDDFFQNYQLKIILLQCTTFDAQNTKDYEIVSQNQMLKDLQEKMQKDKEQVASANSNDDLNNENKKRQYITAFEEDQDSRSSVKKLKSNNSEQIGSVEVFCEESNSINDASDAISDEDDLTVQSKSTNILDSNSCHSTANTNSDIPLYKNNNNIRNGNQQEILVEDDDCLIEENSNEFINNKNGTNNNNNNHNHSDENVHDDNVDDDDQDDDVIECSSDETDIIEISENGNSTEYNTNNNIQNHELKQPQQFEQTTITHPFNYKKMKLLDNNTAASNPNGNHNESQSLKRKSLNNEQENLDNNKVMKQHNGNSNDDDGITVIE